MRGLLLLSDVVKRALEGIAFASGWLLVVLMCVTCIDVFGRKLGIPIPLTKFQELEWHLHTTVFSMWMGYNYTINAHPRVDSYTETLRYRTKAWIEFFGLTLLALPFMAILVYHGWDFVRTSFVQGEGSENMLGLDHRWIIKGIFYIGLWLVLLGILSVLIRLVAFLFGGRTLQETGLQIGHAELEV